MTHFGAMIRQNNRSLVLYGVSRLFRSRDDGASSSILRSNFTIRFALRHHLCMCSDELLAQRNGIHRRCQSVRQSQGRVGGDGRPVCAQGRARSLARGHLLCDARSRLGRWRLVRQRRSAALLVRASWMWRQMAEQRSAPSLAPRVSRQFPVGPAALSESKSSCGLGSLGDCSGGVLETAESPSCGEYQVFLRGLQSCVSGRRRQSFGSQTFCRRS